MSQIKFSPILGAQDEGPLSYLLEIDNFRILLDCGWNHNFKLEDIEHLLNIAELVDCVLISHPDLAHLGALPALYGRKGITAPIYGTIPIFKMGQMFLYDALHSRLNNEDFNVFTVDHIDDAFDNFEQLKYSQKKPLEGKGVGLSVTPYPAGHLIGGTVWRIQKETEDIIYACDYNHHKEIHLNPTVLETLHRPSLLITGAINASSAELPKRHLRDAKLIEALQRTLRNDGNVLLPVDTAGRVLEMLPLLDLLWKSHKLSLYKIVYLSNVAPSVVEFVSSMLEWTSRTIMSNYDNTRQNPFELKNIECCHTVEDYDKVTGPHVVLASMANLDTGFARDIFLRFAQSDKNLVLFTREPKPTTLAHRLLHGRPKALSIPIWRRIPLEGEELSEYQEQRREEKRLEMERRRLEEEKIRKAKEVLKLYDYEGEDIASTTSLYNLWKSYDLYFDILSNKVKPDPSKGIPYPMFPSIERRALYDDYGEIIRPEDYMITEERIPVAPMPNAPDDMEVDSEDELPTKPQHTYQNVEVRATVDLINFEGRSDGTSIRKILQYVEPRKLIIVHGTSEAISELRDFCEKQLPGCQKVFAPMLGEHVDVASDTNVYKIQLKDSLIKKINFKKVGNCEVGYFDGILQSQEKGFIMENVPIANEADEHDTVFIGDIKFAKFIRTLQEHNVKARFRAGGILGNRNVQLKRKAVEGKVKIEMEGTLSRDFFKVRDVLYNEFTIL